MNRKTVLTVECSRGDVLLRAERTRGRVALGGAPGRPVESRNSFFFFVEQSNQLV